MADYSVIEVREPDFDSPAFALFKRKTGVAFLAGDCILQVERHGRIILLLSFEQQSCVRPILNSKTIHLSSALALDKLSESDADFINGLFDSIQDLQNGERYSIVFVTARKGWLGQSKRYGFNYIGKHSVSGLYCFERR